MNNKKNKNIVEVKSKFSKIDTFSKIIITLVVLILVYLVIKQFYKPNNVSSTEAKKESVFNRTTSDFVLNVVDWEFQGGFRERLLIDDYLSIQLRTPITENDFNSLKFEINPKDDIEPRLFNERTIRIYFKNKMKLNTDIYAILILKDSKLVYKIVFNNTTYNEDYFRSLR